MITNPVFVQNGTLLIKSMKMVSMDLQTSNCYHVTYSVPFTVEHLRPIPTSRIVTALEKVFSKKYEKNFKSIIQVTLQDEKEPYSVTVTLKVAV